MDRPPSPALDLEAAWQRFSDGLLAFLRRRTRQDADAEDLLQQVFLKMASAPPESLPEERLGAWLYRVARNALVDAHRRHLLRAAAPLEAAVPAETPDDETLRDLTRCLEPMLGTLPAPYAEALRAADLEGRSQLDLARSLGLSHSAVKSRVQRARAMLRENLIACCGSSDGDLDCGTCGDDA